MANDLLNKLLAKKPELASVTLPSYPKPSEPEPEVVMGNETHPEMIELQNTIELLLEAKNGRSMTDIPLNDTYWDVEEAHKLQYRKCKRLGLLD